MQRAADAAVAQLNQPLLLLLLALSPAAAGPARAHDAAARHQRSVYVDPRHVVDDHSAAQALAVGQDVPQQRGLASA
jgi:hypothetical protein